MEAMEVGSGFWKDKKVFLTGHTGFKGSWAALWLHELGAEVYGYALAPTTSPNLFEALNLANFINHQIGDIRDEKRLTDALIGSEAEVVIHMAAQPLVRYSYQSPVETYSTNIMGTVNLIEAIRKTPSVKAVVVVTTDKVYENREWVWGYRENETMGGYDPYSSSKACAEIVVSAMRRSFFGKRSGGHSALIATARAGNVIGGGDWSLDRLVPDLVSSFSEGRTVSIRNPQSTRPWQHVLEPVRGYFILAEKLVQGSESCADAWNFGPDEEGALSVGELVEKVSNIWGAGAKWKIDNQNHPHEANFLKLDISKAKRQLNWRPRWRVQKALAHTVEWYKEFYQHPAKARDLCLQQIKLYSSELSHDL